MKKTILIATLCIVILLQGCSSNKQNLQNQPSGNKLNQENIQKSENSISINQNQPQEDKTNQGSISSFQNKASGNQNQVQNNKPNQRNVQKNENSNSANQSPKQDSNIKEFTLEELKKYDGQNGNPAYVAVDGKVYDVTNIPQWRGGKHFNGITAGKDLSQAINDSPHGRDVLADVPVVGILK